MKRYLLFLGLLVAASFAQAQTPSPAMQQKLPIIIQGGTVHVGNGTVIQNAEVRILNGKLDYVGQLVTDASKATNVEIINATGKHIYPSLILLNSTLGLNEVEAVRATLDYAEVGEFNPHVRSLIAYNTDSEVIPVTRSNGILLAQLAPQNGYVCGTSSVVQLDAWNWEDAAYKTDDGIYFNYPSSYAGVDRWAGDATMEKEEKAKEQVDKLDAFLQAAEAYSKMTTPPSPTNLKLAAMKGLFDGTKRAYIRVDFAKDIIASIQLLKKYGVKTIAVVGGMESPMVADFLKTQNVAVIVNQSFTLPSRMDEGYDEPYRLAAKLQQAGVLFSMSYADDGVRNLRNLPFAIGMACGFGLDKEMGLSAITLNAAKILGIEAKTGSLEVGKDANIVISQGDILDMRTNNITHAFIQGRIIDLANKQTRLHTKFMNKYKSEKAVERE